MSPFMNFDFVFVLPLGLGEGEFQLFAMIGFLFLVTFTLQGPRIFAECLALCEDRCLRS